MTVLAAIRAALRPVAVSELEDDPLGEPAASTPLRTGAEPKEGAMPNDTPAPDADSKPGISQGDHDAAVAKAGADGKAEGMKAANDRIAAALGAEGVKGDGRRMGAALDLALKSPDMAAADVVTFVTGNIGQGAAEASTYEQQRLAAAGLTETGKPGNQNNQVESKAGWSKAFSRIGR